MRFSFWPAATQAFTVMKALGEQVERLGYDGLWLADHFMPNAKDTSAPWPEAWTTLAALAATLPRLRLGPLVTGNTYRHPAVLAKMAATVDHICEGRLVLGLGAGWQENEHRKYGIEFGTLAERLARLDEACQVIKALLHEDSANFAGAHYQLQDAPLWPKPHQPRLPLMIGGGGEKVTLRIAAQYADEWNVWGTPETLKRKMAILDSHCERLGRDPAEIQRSAVALVFVSNDPSVIKKAKSAAPAALAGSVPQLQEEIAAYQSLGVQEFILPDFNLGPDLNQKKLETLQLFIEEIAPTP